MFNVSELEWQIAKEIQTKLLAAVDESSRQEIIRSYCSNHIELGQLGTAYLPCSHSMRLNNGTNIEKIGIPGLHHNFIAVNHELYVIGNIEENTFLGKGKFGQVFLGQNEQGRECAIKVEPKRLHKPNEVTALDKMGYLQNSAEINDQFYTIMDRFPGRGLMLMHKKGKVSDPWQAAVKELGFNLKNLAQVKRDFQYDSFDDKDFDSAICQKMSQGVSEFTLENLNQLKTRVEELKKNNLYTEVERYQFIIAAAAQLKKAFDVGILHRDIKGDNFVGRVYDDQQITIAMVDYGGSILISKAQNSKEAFGSPQYMAPEVLRSLPDDARQQLGADWQAKLPPTPEVPEYSCASDIYSFSIMCGYDFGLEPDAGFGILKLAQETNPNARPSIEDILSFLTIDLAYKCGKYNDISLVFEEFRNLELSSAITDDFIDNALSMLVAKKWSNTYQTNLAPTMGFGVFQLATARDLSQRPSNAEIKYFLDIDLACQSGKQKDILNAIENMRDFKPSTDIMEQFKTKALNALIDRELNKIIAHFANEPNTGFGVLLLAKEHNAEERPSIKEIYAFLKMDLACKSGNKDKVLKAINDMKNFKPSTALMEQFKDKALATLVDRELNKIKDDFSLQYDELTKSQLKSYGVLSAKVTNVKVMSMQEVINDAIRPYQCGHRKQNILKKNGWLDNNNQPAGVLKTLLDCQEQLVTTKQNVPKLQ